MKEILTPEEQGIISMVRLNKAARREYVINWKRAILGWEFHLTWKDSKNLWGRFGGGWNWKIGLQIGGRTIIINLLVMALRISREEKVKP